MSSKFLGKKIIFATCDASIARTIYAIYGMCSFYSGLQSWTTVLVRNGPRDVLRRPRVVHAPGEIYRMVTNTTSAVSSTD